MKRRRIAKREKPVAEAIRLAVEAEIVERIAAAVAEKDETIMNLAYQVDELRQEIDVMKHRLVEYRTRVNGLLDKNGVPVIDGEEEMKESARKVKDITNEIFSPNRRRTRGY